MKQLVLTRYGLKSSSVSVREVEEPLLEEGFVIVSVHFVGLSFTDSIIALGLYSFQRKTHPLPCVLGFEFSGVVKSSASEKFSVGDRVCGITRFGACSTSLKLSEECLVRVPDSCSLERAAALPVNAFTARFAIGRLHECSSGKAVVLGASGGVGVHLLHELSSRGFGTVAVVGSKEKTAYVRLHGAGEVRERHAYYLSPSKADCIFLNDGIYTSFLLQNGLKTGGQIVVYGFHGLVHPMRRLYVQLIAWIRMRNIRPFTLVEGNKSVAGFNIVQCEVTHPLFGACMESLAAALNETWSAEITIHTYGSAQIMLALSKLYEGTSVGKFLISLEDLH